jgi:hypothetical protein
MPSKKPLLALRLSKPVHERLLSSAAADGRTPTNYIEQMLKRAFGIASGAPTVRAAPAAQPIAVAAPARPPPPPVPKRKPVPTFADTQIGAITTDDFDVPGDWVNGDGFRRDQIEDLPGEDHYYPPPAASR